jgi:ketosteroid isomerase-like protein
MVTERGFLVQATIERDGRHAHVVQLLTVDDGKVTACEEYIADESPPS